MRPKAIAALKLSTAFLGSLCLFMACKLNPPDAAELDSGVTQDAAANDADLADGGPDADAETDAVPLDAAPPPLDDCFASVSAKGTISADAAEGDQPFYACQTGSPRCQWLPHCKRVSANNLRNGICVTNTKANYEACDCSPGERCIGVSTEDARAAPDSGVCRVAYLCVSKTCFPDAGWPYDCTTTPAPY